MHMRNSNQHLSDTVKSFWERRVDARRDAPFLIDGERTSTYGEFDLFVNRLAHGLRSEGISAGSRVALLVPNDARLLRLELALQKLGAVMVPMIAGATHGEITYVLRHCRPSHLFTDAHGWETITAGGGLGVEHPIRAYVYGGAPGATDAEALAADRQERPADPGIGPLDPMSIMYTSGSTGRPKGVVQPGVGFVSAGHAIADRLDADQTDNFFCALPLFHTAATHMMLAPAIAAGARFTLISRFSRDRFWDQVRGSGGTISLLMPAQLSILMTAPPRPTDRDHTMRTIFTHIRPDAFVKRFGVDVCTTWAMTETSGMGMLTAPGRSAYPAKLIGRPMPDDAEVKVIGTDGQPVASGGLGELCFRHPHVMTGYLNDHENTRRTLVDGWVHSGDLCAMDERGDVYFHGRLKHVIKRAGENIAGEEVEFTIMGHPGVEECVVCGVEDPIYTEEVHATVVVREGHEVSEDEVAQWCAERLSSWKIPRYIRLQSESFPKLANGKTNRRAIVENADPSLAWDRARRRERVLR
jgi:acyl-CoA synthetase (AMP-forming)/AMP-acid ligase II